MKPRFKMVLKIDTMAHANTIKNSIITQLSGKDIFEQHSLTAFTDEDGLISGIGEWRFNNNLDRDSIKNWIQDQVQNNPQVKVWVSLANLSWHDCTHDESTVKDCSTNNYFEWTR